VLSSRRWGWNGIETAARPRVAAEQSSDGQPAAADRAVNLNRLQRICRAARVVAADVAVQRTDRETVDLQQADQEVLHRVALTGHHIGGGRYRAAHSRTPTTGWLRTGAPAPRHASLPAGRPHDHASDAAGDASPGCGPWQCRPPCSRRNRPGSAQHPSRGRRGRPGPVGRHEHRYARWNGTRHRGSSAADAEAPRTQAESFARPLRRRSARMARPARVRMRRRKPCFLARRRLFG